jgi:beta,beta-carotene 9',10'-dioxygenase
LSTTDDSESLDNICKSGQILCSIRSSHRFGAAYFHSFAITDNYIIFIEQSLKISFYELIKTALFNKPFSKCMITLKDWPAKIHVIRKDTG